MFAYNLNRDVSLQALESGSIKLTMILCCVIHTSTKSSLMWKSVVFPKTFQQSNCDRVFLQTCNPFGGPSLVAFPRLYGGYYFVGCSSEKRECFWIGLWLFGQQLLSAFICSVWMVLVKDRHAQPLHELHRHSEQRKRKLCFYVSAEDSMEQFASGAAGGLTPVQVWRTRPISAKDVQLLKTSCVYYLQRRRTGSGSLQTEEEVSVEVPRFARLWELCLCWIWRRNLCPAGPEWLPSVWKTHRCPARRCSTRAWASRVIKTQWSMELNTRFYSRIICPPQNSESRPSRQAGRQALTSGLNGGSTSPAFSILKLIFWKNGCDCTSLPAELWQPSLCFGFLVSSCNWKEKKKPVILAAFHWLLICAGQTHQWTDLFHFSAELFSIFLLAHLDPLLHIRHAGVFSVGSERRLSGCHFINEAAKAPPVSAHPIMLAADHLRSWNHRLVWWRTSGISWFPWKWHQICVMYVPMYPRVPTLPWTSFPSISLTARPRSEMRMWPFREKIKKSKHALNQATVWLLSHTSDSFVTLSLVAAATDLFMVWNFAHDSCKWLIHFKAVRDRKETLERLHIFQTPRGNYLSVNCHSFIFKSFQNTYHSTSLSATVLITRNSCQVNYLCYFLG